MFLRKPAELFNNPVLHVQKRLPTRNHRHAAMGIKSMPTLITRQRFQRLASPITKLYFVDRVIPLHVEFHPARDCFSSLNRSFKRTAVDGMKTGAVQPIGQSLCLLFSFFVQTNAGCSTPKRLAQPVARCMPD